MLTLSKSKHDLEVTKMSSLMSLLLLFYIFLTGEFFKDRRYIKEN